MEVKLLEVNSNPSLRIDYEREVAIGINEYIHSPLDEEIKRPLVAETLQLVAPKNKMRWADFFLLVNGFQIQSNLVTVRSITSTRDGVSIYR